VNKLTLIGRVTTKTEFSTSAVGVKYATLSVDTTYPWNDYGDKPSFPNTQLH